MQVSRLFCCVQGEGLPRSRCSLAMTKKERYQPLAMPEGERYAGGKRGMPEGTHRDGKGLRVMGEKAQRAG